MGHIWPIWKYSDKFFNEKFDSKIEQSIPNIFYPFLIQQFFSFQSWFHLCFIRKRLGHQFDTVHYIFLEDFHWNVVSVATHLLLKWGIHKFNSQIIFQVFENIWSMQSKLGTRILLVTYSSLSSAPCLKTSLLFESCRSDVGSNILGDLSPFISIQFQLFFFKSIPTIFHVFSTYFMLLT